MAFPALVSAHQVPLDRLFPEQYEASKRMIARDFAFFGVTIVLGLVLAALVNIALF